MNFIESFKCLQCLKEPSIQFDKCYMCHCGRTCKSTLNGYHYLIFNVSLNYAWYLYLNESGEEIIDDKHDKVWFLLIKNTMGSSFSGPKRYLNLDDVYSPSEDNILDLSDIPDFIKYDWQSMINTIEMLDTFS